MKINPAVHLKPAGTIIGHQCCTKMLKADNNFSEYSKSIIHNAWEKKMIILLYFTQIIP